MKALIKALTLAYALGFLASTAVEAAAAPRRAAIPKAKAKPPARIRAKAAPKPKPKPNPVRRAPMKAPTRPTPKPIPAPISKPAPAPSPSPSSIPADLAPAIALRVFDLTNEQRFAAGLPPLAWDDRLARSAQGHAADLAARNVLQHVVDGVTPLDRALAEGYPAANLGENLFRVSPAPPDLSLADEMVAAWMDSPGHCANILSPDFTQMGVAVVLPAVEAGSVGVLGVQEFGRPLP